MLMNEITKLYENAGIKPQKLGYCDWDCNCPYPDISCGDDCPYWKYEDEAKYPPFTAEKQVEVENIIFQCNFGICELLRRLLPEFTKNNRFVKLYFAWQYHAGDIGYYDETTEETYGDWDVECINPNRKEALAGFINALWNEYLTEEKRKQIKEILE